PRHLPPFPTRRSSDLLSSLSVSPEIKLVAPNATAWTEVWRLDASAIWHAESKGIPVIHAAGATRTPEWRPWPGEEVTITVSRPRSEEHTSELQSLRHL